MKKIISFLLAFVMCLSLAIYGGGHAAADTAKTKKMKRLNRKRKQPLKPRAQYTRILTSLMKLRKNTGMIFPKRAC